MKAAVRLGSMIAAVVGGDIAGEPAVGLFLGFGLMEVIKRPFCPVVPSSTNNTSCGASGISFRVVRVIFSSSAIRLSFVCSRPAVSTMMYSTLRAMAAWMAS